MRVSKKGKIVDIPVRQRTVVRLRSGSSGTLTNKRAIIMGIVPPSNFSRAYGKQVYVCTVYHGKAHISTTGAGDVYPVGRTKRVPKVCKLALHDYREGVEPFTTRKSDRAGIKVRKR